MKARSNLFLNAASGIGHFPFLSITIPSAAYFSGFKNRKIISPLLRDTSCSADGPPISTPTRILPIGTFIRFYFLRGGRLPAGRQGTRTRGLSDGHRTALAWLKRIAIDLSNLRGGRDSN